MRIFSKNYRPPTIPANSWATVRLFQKHPQLKSIGWTQENVSKLLCDLHGILDNFHRLTKHHFRLELQVGFEADDNEQSTIAIDPGNRKILVFLQAGPDLVLSTAPLILGEALFLILIAGTHERRSPVKIISGKTRELVDAATVAIENCYLQERKLYLDKKELHRTLSATTQTKGQTMIRCKTVYQTLCGSYLPRVFIAKSFQKTIDTTRQKLAAIQVDRNVQNIIPTIGRLAMIHTISKRNGLAEVSLATRRVMTEESGDQLVLIELLQMRAGRSDPSPPPPWMIELQLRTGKPSYGVIFDQLVRIFDHYYDSIELVPGF